MGEYKTAGLCSWKQNQSKNELDAWENESYTWKRYQSYNKRVQFLEKLFQAGYSTSIIIYRQKKTEQYKELFNIINNEVSEEFKNKPVSNVFSLLTMLIFTK
jgi:ubiquinone biosynthesis protein COQ9